MNDMMEAGASDNRLSFNPNQFSATAAWQDGSEYVVTLRLRQTSPGEAEVISIDRAQPAESQEVAPPEPETAAATQEQTMEHSNPAIARMMGRMRGNRA